MMRPLMRPGADVERNVSMGPGRSLPPVEKAIMSSMPAGDFVVVPFGGVGA